MITNSYNLKRKLKKLNLEEDKTTLASLDIKNMYPSIRISVIEKAVLLYEIIDHRVDTKITVHEKDCWR